MSNNINIEVGKRIFDARKKLKLSRAELGKKVGLHESTVKRYEDGQIKALDIEKMKEFANALEVDAKVLMGWDEQIIKLNIPWGTAKSKEILKLFRKLNVKGQDEALKRIEELTYIPKYTAHDNIETIAAHNDNIKNKDELDKVKDDIEDMKNW